jgi:Protein of unknown function (DUF2281)
MGIIAEKIFETVKTLPDRQAEEVLDFAQYLQARAMRQAEGQPLEDGNFFACAGIWKDRDITQETLRGLAWRDDAL